MILIPPFENVLVLESVASHLKAIWRFLNSKLHP